MRSAPRRTPVPDLAAAKLLLSIGDDFVEEGSLVEQARALAELRAAGGRFVYVGPRLSLTAAAADEWLSVEPGTELLLVLGLARRVLELVGRRRTRGALGRHTRAHVSPPTTRRRSPRAPRSAPRRSNGSPTTFSARARACASGRGGPWPATTRRRSPRRSTSSTPSPGTSSARSSSCRARRAPGPDRPWSSPSSLVARPPARSGR